MHQFFQTKNDCLSKVAFNAVSVKQCTKQTKTKPHNELQKCITTTKVVNELKLRKNKKKKAITEP